jgi:imidazole glycerol-phosphate synthase subunit HisH
VAETIGIIDYGMGNLHSLGKALERVASSQRIVISYDADELRACDKLVLPGVGGVKACMDELRRLEINDMVREQAAKVPLLGICLGMQVLHEWSDENGGVPALGVIPGKVVRFPDPAAAAPGASAGALVSSSVTPAGTTERLKVPHMGWNRVKQTAKHPMWEKVPDESWFYFVHSYHSAPRYKKHVLGTADYGHPFAAAVAKDNVVAFQFHPEKSQAAGMTLLANFVAWDGKA